MYWIRGYAKFLTAFIACWCVAFTLVGAVISADPAVDFPREDCISTTAIPAVDFSDTAVQHVALRLTHPHWQMNSLAALITGRSGILLCYGRCSSQAKPSAIQWYSLFDLGTALRL